MLDDRQMTLRLPEPKEPFIAATDANDHVVGGCDLKDLRFKLIDWCHQVAHKDMTRTTDSLGQSAY